ncbi:MAG: glutamine-hydrolyzing GMP synthase, partial [Pseudobdellovibrionaceae bacterium]
PTTNVVQIAEKFPVLAVCYGMQLVTHQMGGKVTGATSREYGRQQVTWAQKINGVPENQNVWMSHGDVVEKLPPGFKLLATSENHPAAMENSQILALQFHPEVVHTENGNSVLEYFLNKFQLKKNWLDHDLLSEIKKTIQNIPATDSVLCALSGGVDSTVVAHFLTKELGPERVICVFINNGLLRKNEFQNVQKVYEKLELNIEAVDASREFLSALQGISDPEAKRKTIGRLFIEVFDHSVSRLKSKYKNLNWLAQGTLYPDVIESISSVGGSVTIKSHHNVGGLPEQMNLKLVEPFRFFFKDEVRRVGTFFQLPAEIVHRHPFPGPGLAIRVLGEITEAKLSILRDCDEIFINYLREKNLYSKIWQAAVVLLPVQSVGVQGDGRSYDYVVALRAVSSVDGMTADWYPFDVADLQKISNAITNKVKGVNRVVYDITSKPPATIEWE